MSRVCILIKYNAYTLRPLLIAVMQSAILKLIQNYIKKNVAT